MFICPKCQSDNQLGAIFCRSCGEKLDIDDLKPADLLEGKAAKNVGKIVRNFIGLVVLLFVGGILAGVFLPVPVQSVASLTPEQENVMRGKVGAVMKASGREVSLSLAEINALAEQVCSLSVADVEAARLADAEAGSMIALVKQAIRIELVPPSTVRITVEHLLKDKLTMYSMIEGSLAISPEGRGMTFTRTGAAAGKIPLPIEGLQQMIVDKRFVPLTEKNDRYTRVLTILANIKTFEMEAGQIKVRSVRAPGKRN
jgi:hypothetical protein